MENKKGLTQEDFRNLLLKNALNDDSPPRTKGGGKFLGNRNKVKNSNKDDDKYEDEDNPYLLPRSVNKGKRTNKGYNKHFEEDESTTKKWKKNSEEEAYRDRAKERRLGLNPDYEETDKILSNLEQLAQEKGDKQLAYHQSKYLGGDIEHTHLVKGLDYALLAKVREQKRKEEEQEQEEQEQEADLDDNLDEEFEKLYQMNQENNILPEANKEDSPSFLTGLGERIYNLLKINSSNFSTKNPKLFPGRMVYTFDVIKGKKEYNDPFYIPTSLVRSALEAHQIPEEPDELEKKALDKAIQVFKIRKEVQKNNNNELELIGTNKNCNKGENISIGRPSLVLEDSEDEMFSDVGEYELDLDAILQKQKNSEQENKDL